MNHKHSCYKCVPRRDYIDFVMKYQKITEDQVIQPLQKRVISLEGALHNLLAELGVNVKGKVSAPQLGRIATAILRAKAVLNHGKE